MSQTTFAHYKVETPLGRGGMGEVFRAFDPRLNRPVAIKVMRAGGDRSSLAAQRFIREARAASALNHPNIVVIYEVGETEGGDHFIVQEFIEGRTLRAMIDPALDLSLGLDIAGQVARALSVAHASGIVHRDIKPENIMVRPDGFVKVLDFGLARVVESDLPTQTNIDTAPGTLLGTPAYMAPEQASGRVCGPPADVFALGVVLYEIATGRRPFIGPTPMAVVASIISDQPVPLARVKPSVPRVLSDLVDRMLDKHAEVRPDAREVESALATLRASDAAILVSMPAREGRRQTVGREDERGQLLRAYARAKNGRSLIAAVSGEPGIGKTSLVEDFFADLETTGERPIIARGRCSENLAGAEAYLPILEVLDNLLHRGVGPRLDTLIKTVAPTWYVQVATGSSAAVAVGEVRATSPAASQDRMKRELAAFLQELSRLQPVVIFIDDLHWADVSTVDILNYLSGRFEDMRVLVLTTYRPSDMALARHPFLGIRNTLQGRGLYEDVALDFLVVGDVERYLELQFPAHKLPADFAATIHAKTEGSPLFMADLVRYLRDTGGIIMEDGSWVLARSMPDVPRDLPESVRGMIARKIEAIDEQDRRLLLAASIQGHEFDSTVIAEAADMDPGDVEERLEVLERVHVFVRRGEEHEFGDRTLTVKYRFVHVLYQNVLYASLQPTRRAALSKRIATALVTHLGRDTAAMSARLGVLFETARDFASSAKFFYLAAQRAVTLIAFREALSLTERGLAGLRSLPDGPERQQRELGLQMVRILAVRNVKGWASPELEPAFARAREICQQLGEAPSLFPVLWNHTFFQMIRGDLARVKDEVQALLARGEASGESAFLMGALHIAGVASEFIGDFVASSEHLQKAKSLHVPARHQEYTGMFGLDPGMLARAMGARPLWALGHPERARRQSLETIALARTQRQPPTLVFALVVAQSIHLYRGEPWEVLAFGAESIALCAEHRLAQESEWALTFQASALVQIGHTDVGIEQLQLSLAALKALKSGLVRTAFLTLLAEALCRVGRVDEGLAALDEGFAHAEQTIERGFLAELLRLRGELRSLKGDVAGAEADLRAAIDDARARQTRSFELRAATGLARLLAPTERAGDARAALKAVYDTFTEGHDTHDLMVARDLLVTLEGGMA
jgi:predicted ATPase